MEHVHIEKLVFGGQGLGRLADGQVVFVWNVLPGEDVEIDIIKRHKTHIEAVAKRIITPSPDRVEPRESHWLSSSPWQMLSWDKENEWKRAIAAETYNKIGHMAVDPDHLEIATDNNPYGYRNKIEFSFVEVPDGAVLPPPLTPPLAGGESLTAHRAVTVTSPPARGGVGGGGSISLAFFERGARYHIPATGSLLADPAINATANTILAWINAQKITIRSLKSLIVRSDGAGHTITALFIKDRFIYDTYPTLNGTFLGFHLYYSTHKSPASVPTALLYSTGQDYLIATLSTKGGSVPGGKNTKLKFGLLSFFQINLPVFQIALGDIATFLHPNVPIIDYYSGVGAISLPLSQNQEACTLIDNNAEAIRYATENITINARKNCEAICVPSEDLADIITPDKMIILDPPRAGLHERLLRQLLTRKPPRIIYLSCGLDTQARDIKLLSEKYQVTFLKLYNFFPRTPHIEGLCVLDLK